jgi:hypothetical protein
VRNFQGFILYLILFCLLVLKNNSLAQIQVKDSVKNCPLVVISYSLLQPAGDMGIRFGITNSIGGKFQYKNKNNLILGLSGNFIFGNNVHEPGLLTNIATTDGYFIGADGQYAEVRFYERGFSAFFDIGKIFPLSKATKNSGILLMISTGFLQHKIRIEDSGNVLPSLNTAYLKGYDRLTNGLAVNSFVGYIYLSKNQRVNLFAGLEFIQAWTENRRLINFETGLHDGKNRHDYLNGIRVGWILPLYKRATNQFYYN